MTTKLPKQRKPHSGKGTLNLDDQHHRPRKHYDGIQSMVCWLVFGCAIALWGVTFGIQLSSVQDSVEHADQGVDQELAGIFGSRVLGTADASSDQGSTVGETTIDQASDTGDQQDQAVAELVDEIEEQRREKIRGMLQLQLPTEFDNPNYPVTFVEPTETGVEIQVDGGGFSKKKSPFQLPSLAIGKHTINFRFIDMSGVTQNLEAAVIVIPRAPAWSETQELEFRNSDSVIFSGIALPHSTVVLLVGSTMVSQQIEADAEGAWEIALTEKLESGDHSAVCFVRKDGYASNFSEPLAFTVGIVEGISSGQSTSNAGSTGTGMIASISDALDKYVTEENYYFVIGAAGLVVIGLVLVLSVLVRSLRKKQLAGAGWVAKEEVAGKEARSEDEEKKVSLREKFARAGLNVGVLSSLTAAAANTERVKEEKTEVHPQSGAAASEKMSQDAADPVQPPVLKQDASQEKNSRGKKHQGLKPKQKKVYSKEEFLGEFADTVKNADPKESNKIQISLTSRKR